MKCTIWDLQARPLLTKALDGGSFDCLADPKLGKEYDHNEMVRMVACAAACVQLSPRDRPQMSQVNLGLGQF